MYICKHFDIRELVPPETHAQRGDACWQLLDPRILMAADIIVEKFGSTICNSWHDEKFQKAVGSKRVASGLRVPGSPEYSPTSQHTFGRALDLITLKTPVSVVRKYIIEHPGEFPTITAIEDGVSWLHIDCRNCDPIMLFKS